MDNNLDYQINKELGESYLFMGELDKAEEYYQKAIGSNGVHAEPYLGLATIAVQKGELQKAHNLYSKASSVEQNDKALAGLAMVESEIGSREKAFELLVEALTINPSNIIALYIMIQAGYALQRIQETLQHVENYLQIDPENKEVMFTRAGCLKTLGRKQEALIQVQNILAKDPDNTAARELLAQLD
ncbi:tetratricopeptide repeat protein [Desulfonatronospira sp.]|uniref:tetratricopeptide repeat protein n=1 Tax=Desulfonatronospira sp. TaxID=1962951 RepID=UPI0025BD6AC5|nr:tetratricopeptide repeat protein [Desulfonatronospira sp.]